MAIRGFLNFFVGHCWQQQRANHTDSGTSQVSVPGLPRGSTRNPRRFAFSEPPLGRPSPSAAAAPAEADRPVWGSRSQGSARRPPRWGCRGAPGLLRDRQAHPPGAAPGSAGNVQRGWGQKGGGERVGLCRSLCPARRAGERLACHGTEDTASCITSGSPSLTPGSSPPPHVSQGPTGCWQRAAPARPPQPGPGERRPGASTCGAGPRPGPAPAPPPWLGTPCLASAAPASASRRLAKGGPAPLPRLRRHWRRFGVGGRDPGPSGSSSPRGKSYREVSPQIWWKSSFQNHNHPVSHLQATLTIQLQICSHTAEVLNHAALSDIFQVSHCKSDEYVSHDSFALVLPLSFGLLAATLKSSTFALQLPLTSQAFVESVKSST